MPRELGNLKTKQNKKTQNVSDFKSVVSTLCGISD